MAILGNAEKLKLPATRGLLIWHCKTVKGDNLERQEGHTGEEDYFYPHLEVGIRSNAL